MNIILSIFFTLIVIIAIISIRLVCHKEEEWTEEDLFIRKTLLDNAKDDDKI